MLASTYTYEKGGIAPALILIAEERKVLTLCSHALGVEACLTKDRLATLFDWARLERDLALVATLSAGCVEHLTLTHALVLALIAAILAALWSAQVLARVEFLLTIGEHERCTAIAAG